LGKKLGNQLRDYMPIVNDDAFARMVAEEVKNKLSPLHKGELMKMENWGKWRDALVALSQNLQNQIDVIEEDAIADERRYMSIGAGGKRLSQEAVSYYGNKSARIKRFKFHVDKRLDEVQLMIDTGKEIESDGWDKVEFLRKAIAKHRSMLREYDLEDTAIDRALWSTLDYKWVFDSINDDNL